MGKKRNSVYNRYDINKNSEDQWTFVRQGKQRQFKKLRTLGEIFDPIIPKWYWWLYIGFIAAIIVLANSSS